jgi:hypothetical protein
MCNKIIIILFCCLLFLSLWGCKNNDGIVNAGTGQFAEDFETLWNHFDKEYCYFSFKNIDWKQIHDLYRPAVDTAASFESFVSICVAMLTPLRDGHVYFIGPNGTYVPTHINSYPPNYDASIYKALYQQYNGVMINNSTGYIIVDSILCIGIQSWLDAQFNIADFDNILDSNNRMLGVIIDVRANGGGDQNLALEVAGRFTAAATVGSYSQVRSGPLNTDLTPLHSIMVTPRGKTWTKPVAVLTGRKCFSSNEGFISAMENIPLVTTIGDTTGGGSGNPKFYSFSNGWQYTVPQWIEYTADKKIIEWNGISPDIYVKADSTDFARGDDPVFDYAINWIKKRIQNQN